jgi:DNA-binding LytR/AlgR family response regulator
MTNNDDYNNLPEALPSEPSALSITDPPEEPLVAVRSMRDRESDAKVITPLCVAGLVRLLVKKGEYVYARPNDIVMIESCDHLVKVYLAYDDKCKKTIRSCTLKDFLSQLPDKHFLRIGRFCAINSKRLSGGSFNEQSFEFDFKISIKLRHAVPNTVFNTIGN